MEMKWKSLETRLMTDFEAIEKEMASIIKEDRTFTRYELPVNEGMTKLQGEGSKYKLDNLMKMIDHEQKKRQERISSLQTSI